MKKIINILLVVTTICVMNIQLVSANSWLVINKEDITERQGNKIGQYYFIFDENFDENHKRGLEYSSDGINFVHLENVRTNSYPRYDNNLYFVIDTSMENVPINKRYVGFENSPAYILNENLNVINTINNKCYINYLGYFNGYNYLDFTYYVSNSDANNWESKESGHLYKTNDGIELLPVDFENEDVTFIGGINLYDNSIIKTAYGRDDKFTSNLFLSDKQYNILREKNDFVGLTYKNNTIPLLSMSYKVGEEVVDWIDAREAIQSIEKKYLTMDGVYGVEMPNDIGAYRFELNGNFYFDKDDSSYYCIAKSELENKIKVVYNDKILAFDTPPTTESDRTLVPMRFLFEQMGADVEWNNNTQTATVQNQNEVIAFSINNTSATVNNQIKTMDVPARLVNDKTMIPLRFLSEELGYNVKWDETTKIVTISD